MFSVGETVETNMWGLQKIEGFICTSAEGNYVVEFETCRNLLAAIKKVKNQPVFTTEDGIEYTDRNAIVYGVCPKGQWEENEKKVHYAMTASAWKFFSTKQARYYYVMMNKPILSIADAHQILILTLYISVESSDKLWEALKTNAETILKRESKS